MYTIFMHLNATKEWLALTLERREQFVDNDLAPIFARFPDVRLTFYDVEAFSAQPSDIAVFETDNLDQYIALIDALRNTKMYTAPYFNVMGIFPAKAADFV